ncbi:MAG TPA: glycine oxidase ThiO [Pyrinomonadaceae bacterium]|nr:glycine oxidase ThiO [Pyrinomonadaceae bacterium]
MRKTINLSASEMNELPQTTDVAIIGGGVIGLAVARALSLRGVANVTVIERSSFGAESSGAAAGMLGPQAEADTHDEFFSLCSRSRDLYPAFAAQLFEETGIDIELETAGTLYLGLNEEDVKELERRYEWQAGAGLAVERLSAESARKLEPSTSSGVRLALLFPRDTQVENRLLIKALVASNQSRGVNLVDGTSVTSVKIARGRIKGLETSRGFVATGRVVVAAGGWSSLLTASQESNQAASDSALPDLGIEPVRGQMLCFDTNPAIFSHVIYSPRGYVVPRRDGRLLAGSTTEHVGFDKRTTDEGMRSIHSAATEISPLIRSLTRRETWAGLRPRAADGLPVIGAYAEIAGLFYATGHYRNGILLAPITGELIADTVTNSAASSLLNAFSPDRFARVFAG